LGFVHHSIALLTKCEILISRFATFSSQYDERVASHTHPDGKRATKPVAAPRERRAARSTRPTWRWDSNNTLLEIQTGVSKGSLKFNRGFDTVLEIQQGFQYGA
jgi:hypothetical protein